MTQIQNQNRRNRQINQMNVRSSNQRTLEQQMEEASRKVKNERVLERILKYNTTYETYQGKK
jgi:hypothetical protein